MPKSSRFIDGIYNYCDRWCERCSMTRHCRVYEIEQALDEAAPGEAENREFWRQLDERLDLEVEGEEDWMEFFSVEPPTEEEMEEFRQEEEWRDKLIASTDLSQAAEAYMWEVMEWLGQHQPMRRKPTDAGKAKGATLELADALDVISWYHTLIAAKVHRALHGHQEDEWDENGLQSDWNGSAKVALLSVERSIGAWSLVRDHLPQEQGQIRRFIARCGLIRRLLLEKFPDARGFVRPGFDDR